MIFKHNFIITYSPEKSQWANEKNFFTEKNGLTKSLLCDRIVIARLQINTHKRLLHVL